MIQRATRAFSSNGHDRSYQAVTLFQIQKLESAMNSARQHIEGEPQRIAVAVEAARTPIHNISSLTMQFCPRQPRCDARRLPAKRRRQMVGLPRFHTLQRLEAGNMA